MAKNSQEYWAQRRRQDKVKVINTGEKGIDNLKRLLLLNLKDVERQIKEFYDKYGDNPAEEMSYKDFEKYKAKLSRMTKANPQDKTLQKLAKQDIPKYRIDRLRALQGELQMQLTEATNGQEKGIYNTLDDVSKVSQGVLAKTMQASIGLKFNTIASKKMKQLLMSDWSGANWSDRLWKDREKVGKKLTEILEKGVVQGTSLQKMSRELRDITGQSFNNAFRLIRTETSHIDGQVTLEGYRQASEELGLEYYEYDAFLDSRTSNICRELDKKRFKVSEAEVGVNYPPMHPNCRSTTQLVLDEDYKQEESRSENPNNSKHLKSLLNIKKLETPEAVNDFFYYDDEKRGLLAKKNSTYGQWAKSITAEEKEALTSYTGSGYSYMNDHLRGIAILDNKDLEKDIQNLSNVISRFELKDNIKVYRGVDFNAIEGFLKENSINEAKDAIGKKYIDKGFMSTTPLKSGEGLAQFNGKEIQFEINVPKGKGRGSYINDFAGDKKDKEYEFLLQKGSSLTIEDVEEDETFGVIKFKMNLDV